MFACNYRMAGETDGSLSPPACEPEITSKTPPASTQSDGASWVDELTTSRGGRLLGKITLDYPTRSIPSRYTHALFLGASVPAENFKAAFAADLVVMIFQCLRERKGNLFRPLFSSVRCRSSSEGQSHLIECNERLQ